MKYYVFPEFPSDEALSDAVQWLEERYEATARTGPLGLSWWIKNNVNFTVRDNRDGTYSAAFRFRDDEITAALFKLQFEQS